MILAEVGLLLLLLDVFLLEFLSLEIDFYFKRFLSSFEDNQFVAGAKLAAAAAADALEITYFFPLKKYPPNSGFLSFLALMTA